MAGAADGKLAVLKVEGDKLVSERELPAAGKRISKVKVGDVTLRCSNKIEEDQRKIAIHGSEIILHRKTPVNTGDNLFQADVSRITTTGPTAYITVDFGLPMVLTMGRRPYKASNLVVGEKLWVQFSTDAVKPLRS